MEQKVYSFQNETGDASVAVYQVFPGVQLAFSSVHMDQLQLAGTPEGDLIEIHHCREGHIEQAFEDCFFYLAPGDLSIAHKQQMINVYRFPLRHYHGLTIGVNMNAIPSFFRQMFDEIHLDPMAVTQRLCAGQACYILRGERQIEHVLAELYTAPENMKEGYFKLKIPELFLVLSSMLPERNQLPACTLSKANVLLANQAAAYLSRHMDEHITIPELARTLGLSETHLKTIFKSVYGVPVFAYMRVRRMQAAALALIHTEKPIAAIADEFGYANTSKFSAAFQAVMGESPSEFRKAHSQTTQAM